ncbi:hypothetical protein EDD76_11753 [Kineothrix alysoides]|uniref:Alpha/beta hydrolase family protein n=1 Tax=Kineothrix alysoides TaxID=1469948 RepID=A0A4R1QMQ5_9FIRM|nr:alpha/beta hydrolase [Kineothrix alysoides]TCL55018.1 hypothetical protein EDD76_11753 [Kineothrix alysoides]
MSIYKSKEGRRKSIELYDKQLSKLGFDNVKTKVNMPTNVEAKKLSEYSSPALIIASEKDCLFPAKRVLSRAKHILPNCRIYEIKDSGHMHILPKDIKTVIIDFLKR